MRTMHFAAAMAAALSLSAPASAGFFDLTLAPYIGFNAGQTSTEVDCFPGTACGDDDFAWKLFGGLEVNEYMAMEVGYVDLGEVKDIGALTGTRFTNGMVMNILGTYAINPSFTLLARGGLNILNTEVNGTIAGTPNDNTGDTDVAWSFGLGAQFNASPAVGIRLEWERFFEVGSSAYNDGTGEADIDMTTLGIVYKF
jgi:OmpA-OmpF porin, OOP family